MKEMILGLWIGFTLAGLDYIVATTPWPSLSPAVAFSYQDNPALLI